jgi:hypothetical protein
MILPPGARPQPAGLDTGCAQTKPTTPARNSSVRSRPGEDRAPGARDQLRDRATLPRRDERVLIAVVHQLPPAVLCGAADQQQRRVRRIAAVHHVQPYARPDLDRIRRPRGQ